MIKYPLSEWIRDIQPKIREAGYDTLPKLPGYHNSGILGLFGEREFFVDFVSEEFETYFKVAFT